MALLHGPGGVLSFPEVIGRWIVVDMIYSDDAISGQVHTRASREGITSDRDRAPRRPARHRTYRSVSRPERSLSCGPPRPTISRRLACPGRSAFRSGQGPGTP